MWYLTTPKRWRTMPSFRPNCPASLALLALAAACAESPSGPREPVGDQLDSLIVTATVLDTEVSPVPDRSPWIECRVRIDVRAAGPVDGPIELKRIDHAFFTGVDTQTPADTIIATANRLTVEFGRRTLYGNTLTSEWDLRADAPYELRAVLQFEDHTGDDGVAPFSFRCGPSLDDDSTAAPPVIGELSFAPSGETVELGTPVSIHYEASSTLGLWETWLIVTHASGTDTVRLNEGLIENTARTVPYPHPSSSVLGDRMSVRVVTFDAALRSAETAPALTPALVDTTAPWVGYRTLAGGSFDGCTPTYCAVAEGDSIHGTINTFEESEGTTLRLSYGAPLDRTDTVPIVNGWFQFRAPPIETPGIYEVTATVIDRHGNDTTFAFGSINVYPVHDAQPLPTAVVSGHPSEAVGRFAVPDFDRGRFYLYSSPDSGSSVYVFDLPDLNQLPPIELSGMPGGLDVSASGVLVATLPEAHAVEFRNPDGGLLRTIPITAVAAADGYQAGHVVLTSEGTLVMTLNRGGWTEDWSGVVVEIDTIAGTQTLLVDSVAGAGYHFQIGRSGDGSRLVRVEQRKNYLDCSRVLDVATGALSNCQWVGFLGLPQGNLSGTRWGGATSVFDEDMAGVGGYPLGDSRDTTAPHPTATDFAYVATGRGLVRFRIADGLILDARPALHMIVGDLWISPDGTLAVGAGRVWGGPWPNSDMHVFATPLN